MNKYQEALNDMYAVLNDSNRWYERKDLLQELVNKVERHENTIIYNEELNTLRQEIEHYRQEVEELRLANARLEALVDARFTENNWSESVGTE